MRTRIALAFALGAACLTGVLGIALDGAIGHAAIEQLRQQALDRLAADVAVYDLTGVAPEGSQVGPAVLPVDFAAAVGRGEIASDWDGGVLRAGRRLGSGDEMLVQLTGDGVAAERERLHRLLLQIGVPLILIASAAGWFVAQALTARLRAAADALGAAPIVGGGDRSGDEVSELVARVEALTATLDERLERERGFSSIVAHELRTPLTALHAASELLPEGEGTAIVRRQSHRLRALVDDLLDLARAESATPALEPHDLGALVRDLVPEADDLTIVVRDAAVVRTDPTLLGRVLSNLLQNARRHGAAPITLAVTGTLLTVEDSGPGFPEALLAAGPQRFVRHGAADGIGLGLTIVQSAAARLGAELRFENTGGGASAHLELPRAAA